MSKRGDKSQLDLDLSSSNQRSEVRSRAVQGLVVVPFVDAVTLQVRRDALRRVVKNGIFSLPTTQRRD